VTVEGIWQARVRTRNAMKRMAFFDKGIACMYQRAVASTFGFAVRQVSLSVPCS
jgi:hypothetical protein